MRQLNANPLAFAFSFIRKQWSYLHLLATLLLLLYLAWKVNKIEREANEGGDPVSKASHPEARKNAPSVSWSALVRV